MGSVPTVKGLTVQQMRDMGYTETEPGIFRKTGPPTHAKAPPSDSVTQEGAKTPKTPEDRLNKTEREFLSRLRNDVYGHMQHIGIQSLTLQLGFDCRYTPDFWTRMQGGDFRLWEVKGFMRDDARVKIHAAARVFPFWTFVLVKKEKGEWVERIIDQ